MSKVWFKTNGSFSIIAETISGFPDEIASKIGVFWLGRVWVKTKGFFSIIVLTASSLSSKIASKIELFTFLDKFIVTTQGLK